MSYNNISGCEMLCIILLYSSTTPLLVTTTVPSTLTLFILVGLDTEKKDSG